MAPQPANEVGFESTSLDLSRPVSDTEGTNETPSSAVPAEVSEFLRLIAKVLRRFQESKEEQDDDNS